MHWPSTFDTNKYLTMLLVCNINKGMLQMECYARINVKSLQSFKIKVKLYFIINKIWNITLSTLRYFIITRKICNGF